jgi:hypothetical protein
MISPTNSALKDQFPKRGHRGRVLDSICIRAFRHRQSYRENFQHRFLVRMVFVRWPTRDHSYSVWYPAEVDGSAGHDSSFIEPSSIEDASIGPDTTEVAATLQCQSFEIYQAGEVRRFHL